MENKFTTGKSLSVKEAAEIMGKSQQFVRIGLQRSILPFGRAIKMSSIWTYYISPKQFYEYVGIEKYSCITAK
jgi:hypothetical protein